jgi:serine protease AprX
MERRRTLTVFVVLLIVIVLALTALSVVNVCIPKANAWALSITQIERLHELGFNGAGVTIGIVDTGVDITHQEFDSASFAAWNDSVNGKPEFYDDSDHGTHIAGILVSKGSFQGLFSGIKMQGIAPEAKLIVAKSISWSDCVYGGGNDSSIAEGIKFCMDNGADIICLSLGKKPEDANFDETSKTGEACVQALNQGIFVVAPAGNDGRSDDGDVAFPSRLTDVIAVGAMDKSTSVASFSSQGHQYLNAQHPDKKPELIAPGVEILSLRANGSYGEMSGTSQATVYVAGIIALLLDAYPEYKHDGAKNQQERTITLFKDVFAKTAKKIGNLAGQKEIYSHDDYYGYGLIQAFAAYEELGKY